jgi:hypothetical protein
MDVLSRVKNGERIMVNLPSRQGDKKTYNLTDGTSVSAKQFSRISEFLTASDAGLIPDAEPQSYAWAG